MELSRPTANIIDTAVDIIILLKFSGVPTAQYLTL